jgi:hypothetical protein
MKPWLAQSKGYAEHGSSLMETMIAAALGLMITSAALEAFVLHHGYFLAEAGKTEMQQDLRAGINLMGAELRLAGPIISMQADGVGFRANVNAVQGTVLDHAPPGQTSVHVTSSRGWMRGKTVRLCSALTCEEHVLARDGTAGHLTLSDPILHEFPSGSHAEVVNEIRYYLSKTSPVNHKLMREVDHGANPLIDHVEEFSLSFLKGDGSSADRKEDVRLVHLQIRTSGVNGRGGRIVRTYRQDMGVRAL